MNGKRITFLYSFSLILLLALSSLPALAQDKRWYTQQQVRLGQLLFKDKCARCHGVNAQGEPDWRELDEEGMYPPPPLDGNAYAWLHTLGELRQQILQGSVIKQGDMPSFKKKLNASQIDAVIAFFQSHWSDGRYRAWRGRQLASVSRHRAQTDHQPLHHESEFWLKRHLSAAQINPGKARKTPVQGILEVRVSGSYMYLGENGRYAFTGDMIDLLDGSNVSELNQASDTRRLLETYLARNMLVYPAQGKERSHVTIFTDTSCVFCRKMHREVPELVASGVTVRFIPYPRRGLDGEGYAELTSIWCADDPVQALSDYIDDSVLPQRNAACGKDGAVDAGYLLGNSVGISGTPLLVLENGERLRGYTPAEEVIGEIDQQFNGGDGSVD